MGQPDDPRVLVYGRLLVGLVDALAAERGQAAGGSDELVPLSNCGVERRALRKLVKQGRLEVVRLGRRTFTTRRALAGLATTKEQGGPAKAAPVDPGAAARAAYAAPMRVVRGRS